LDGNGRRGACRDDDIDPALNKFGRERGITVIPPFRPAIFDCDVAAIDPTELAQALQKSPDEWTPDRRRGRTQESNRGRLTRLLRAHGERPRDRPAAECDQQVPPSNGDCHTPLPCEGAVKGTVSRHERAVFTLKEGSTATLAAQQEDERLSPLSPLASSVQGITE